MENSYLRPKTYYDKGMLNTFKTQYLDLHSLSGDGELSTNTGSKVYRTQHLSNGKVENRINDSKLHACRELAQH
ncbi:Hypothetical protein NTJ_10827 [Nesidiocoris tenuis]|uniref:Uncharacterized protein n=1 Tax=Nesidiocoris tenuis TaxID=355587 RepID=A0ABN7B312_9HEMI|nr:Hypothetical protein NTJ_10827 [Nesidiocoris tenuis]